MTIDTLALEVGGYQTFVLSKSSKVWLTLSVILHKFLVDFHNDIDQAIMVQQILAVSWSGEMATLRF